MSEQVTYLKDYSPPAFTVKTVSLHFDLHDDHAFVKNEMHIQRQHPGELCLDGDELELVRVVMNDKPLSKEAYQCCNGRLRIASCPDAFKLTIETRIYPQENTKLSGLYRSNQMFCTQCEAEGFRRITYFLDRPDVLATYTTRIYADKSRYPVLLSNGNLRASGDAEDGRHWVEWHDPFKKPSYLFALVAGQLVCVSDHFTTRSGKKIDLHIYVEPGNEDKCAHAMASLKRAMKWDEDEYGREYDLDIFMIVAVSDFNMGAMENKGLNIFNAKYILARPDTATDQDYADIEGVVAHEYFHNWTGNRVTCRDWFQLSLKEGLTVFRDQEFSRDMNSREVCRLLDVKALRNTQFPEDAGSMAHPVRPASYQEINNFYTATIYNKGAEVIRMQQTLLGKRGFRRGMDLYFDRFDGQAVTIDDFVRAMEEANGVDFSQFKRWYSQAGTPELHVKRHYEAGCLELFMTQSCPATPDSQDKKPFHFPIRVALFTSNGQIMPIGNEVLELKEKEQIFRFEGLSEEPIVSFLRDFSAPVILNANQEQNELLALLRFETDGYAKWDAAQRLAIDDIHQCYHYPREQWVISKALQEAFRHVLLDARIDDSLRAELLIPPCFEEIVVTLKSIDVDQLEEARDFFEVQLGRVLLPELEACYHSLLQQEDHAMHAKAYGKRKLRHVCLRLMMKAEANMATPLALQQLKQAKTMTDQISALSVLVNGATPEVTEQILQDFYQQWHHDELVLDKWFSVQASCDRPKTLTRVRALLSHPSFNMKNPNKVRALLGAFAQNNPRNFHAADGSGYVFITDQIMALDLINPQVAARLAVPFTRRHRFNAPLQQLMKEALQRLATVDLSPDLRELVMKSLAD